jgi:hypothetical protein
MKPILSFLLLSAAMFQQKCDPSKLASQDSLKEAAKEQAQPYFPDAKVLASQQKHLVAVLTCTHGVGYSTIKNTARLISTDPEASRQFDEARALLSPFGYQGIGIVFDNGEIWYRFEDRTFIARNIEDAMLNTYRADCGFSVE